MKKTTFLPFFLLLSISLFAQPIEKFEGSNTLPVGWNQYQNAFGPNQIWKISSLSATPPFICEGLNAAFIDRENILAGNTSEDYLVSKAYTVVANDQLKFRSRQGASGDQGGTYQIKISTNTDKSILGAYVTLQSWTEPQMNASFDVCQEHAVNLNAYAGQTVFIAFVKTVLQPGAAIAGDRWFLDDIRIAVKCQDPTLGSSSNVGSTSATLTWTNTISPGSTWDLQIIRPGAGQIFTGVPTNAGISSSTTGNIKTFQLAGLLPNTAYQYYVRNSCSADNKSEWIGPYNFQTLPLGSICADPIPTTALPYQTTNSTANYGDFYDTTQANNTNCGAIPATTNYLAGNEVFYSYTAAFTGQIRIQMTPTEANSSIFVYSNCTLTGNCLAGAANVGTTPRVISNFPVTAGQTYTIVISSALPTQTVAFTLLIQQQSCEPPVGSVPTAAQTTLTTATLSWTVPTPATTAWEVAIQPLGSSVPTVPGVSTTTNPYTVTGLTEATQYQYWVRAACSTPGVFSPWAGPYPFDTKICAPADTCLHTFRMTNQGGSGWNGALMDIRQNGILVGTIGSTFTSGTTQNSLPIALCKDKPFDLFWRAAGTQPAQVQVAVINTFGQTIFTKPAGQGAAGSVVYAGTVNCTGPVCTIAPINPTVTGITINSAILGWTAPATTAWDIFIVPFGSPAPTAANTPTYSNIVTNPFSTTIPLLADTQYTFYVRVVCSPDPSPWSAPRSFTTLPTCTKPTALNVPTATITQTSAVLNWVNGKITDNSWEILLVPGTTLTAPTQLPSANPVTGNGTLLIPVATPQGSPYTVNGLTAATIYYYYVRTVCPGNDKSTWAGPFVFNTITCDDADKCIYRFVITDTGGNGWQSGTMVVSQNGIPVRILGPTLGTGSSAVVAVALCKNINFSLTWNNAGSAPNEMGVSIQSPFTDVIFVKPAGTGSVSLTPLYSVSNTNCTPPTCPKPTAMVATATQNAAQVSWTEMGSATQWEVYVQAGTTNVTPPVNGAPLGGNIAPYYTVNSLPFTIPNLLQQTRYTYWVRSICSATNISTWTLLNPTSFFTTPANDECAFAVNIPVNPTQVCAAALVPGSTVGATASAPVNLLGAGCGVSDDDVWYKFTATNNIHVINIRNVVSLPSGATVNHTLFSGNCASTSVLYCSSALQSIATGLVAGQTYFIRVYTAGSTPSQTVTFNMCIGTPPPPATNDECNNAITAVVNLNSKCTLLTPGNLIAATATALPTLATTCTGVADDDVWFKFVATSTIHYFNILNVVGTSLGVNHAVYEGSCTALSLKHCSGINSLASNNATFIVGQTYYVRVWSTVATPQIITFDLCIKSVSTCQNAEFLCGTSPSDPPFIIENTTGILPGAGAVACLNTTPNPTYYVLKIGQSGPVNFEIRQSTDINNFPSSGAPGTDVDFVAWGPFADTQSCSQITLGACVPSCPNNTTSPSFYPSGNIVDCSYSPNPVENFRIPNAIAGQYYVLLLTNFNGSAGFIKLIQTNTVPVPGQPAAGGTICCDVNLGPDQNVCLTSVTLNALNNIDPLTRPDDFVWFFNGVAIPNAIGSTFVATQTGTYSVQGNCNPTSASDTINIVITQPIATNFTYPQSSYCNIAGVAIPTFSAGAVAASFTVVPLGLVLNPTTGQINTGTSATGTYVVTNARPATGACGATQSSTTITIVAPFSGTISYNNPICKSTTISQNVINTAATGGSYSSTPAGLTLNATTGAIQPNSSNSGVYFVSYTLPAVGGCATFVASTTVTIIPISDIELQQGCQGTRYVIEASPVNNSFNIATATFVWKNQSGTTITPITGQPNAIVAALQGAYTVTVTTPDGCISTKTITTNSVACSIQKGISPNGDGKNDAFDLSTLGVKQLEIYNRYGTLVYNRMDYTNQWTGQADNGNELPDGTYFYVIQKKDNTEAVTGWIYINK